MSTCVSTPIQSLKNRTEGLDARGNVAANTVAESSWAVETLHMLETNQEFQDILKAELTRLYKVSKVSRFGALNSSESRKFQVGYERFFGTEEDPREPSYQELIALRLEDEYYYKGIADSVNRYQRSQPGGEDLQHRGRGNAFLMIVDGSRFKENIKAVTATEMPVSRIMNSEVTHR